jgi:hypothetical protein
MLLQLIQKWWHFGNNTVTNFIVLPVGRSGDNARDGHKPTAPSVTGSRYRHFRCAAKGTTTNGSAGRLPEGMFLPLSSYINYHFRPYLASANRTDSLWSTSVMPGESLCNILKLATTLSSKLCLDYWKQPAVHVI